jgi:signal transduction histidine kinase
MLKKRKSLYFFFLYILISVGIFYLSINYINNEEQNLLHQKYTLVSENTKKNIMHLIEDKHNATLVFAISIARDDSIKNSLLKNNTSLLKLDNFSKTLKKYSNFKNIWFQIIDKNGNSFYRSWTEHKNDSLIFRSDLKQILKDKQIQSTISVGRYDMTFKSMIPIFHEKEFIGVFEIISHFNSISKILENDGIDNIFLADKKYKDSIIYPFSKKFIGEYYIANLNAKKYLINLIENNIKKIISSKNYLILENKLINVYPLDNKYENIGVIVSAIDLKDIDISNIKSFKMASIIYLTLTIVLLGFIIGIVNYSLYSTKINRLNKKLRRNIKITRVQKKKNQTILDSQENIIIITDGEILKNSNKALFKFFDTYKNIKEFKKRYKCICETFVDMNDDDYVIDKDYEDNKNWAEHILANSNRNFKAAIKKNNEIHHFKLNVNQTQFENEPTPYIVVTLTDITYEIEQQKMLKNLNENLEHLVEDKTKELKELNESLEEKIQVEISKSKEKDTIIFQQNKMAAIGEMLSNIAHQWRQPLSCITTAASSLQLHYELDKLDKKELDSSCEHIINSSLYLSKTIDDFKNFFKRDSKKQNFLLIDTIQSNLNLLKEHFKMNNVEVILDVDEGFSLYGYKNEFQQAILNIINNSIDAFLTNNITHRRLIIITQSKNHLSIKDNANGIDEKIINKIFEPYFTTKHQSQGTGLSLYMTREILIKHQNSTMQAQNTTFTFDNIDYKGFEIVINFNQ